MKKKLFLALALIAVISVVACGNRSKSDTDGSAAAESGAGSTVMPVGSEWIDPDFAKVLQQKGYIADAETVTPAQVAEITKVEVCRSQLTSLRGIENFVSLEELVCFDNQLTSLDVSKNPKLMRLDCLNNHLTSLDVSKNPKLKGLGCSNNQLTSLDVSKNPKLEELYCSDNQLTSLDVSNNPELRELVCSDNHLTSLDVSKNPQLWKLDCDNNQLTSLNVRNNPYLSNFGCSDNQLTSLDVSKNTRLLPVFFGCSGNPGENGRFRVKVWDDNSNASSPSYKEDIWDYPWDDEYEYREWDYDGKTVKIEYIDSNGTITTRNAEQADNRVYDTVEKMPEFPGGEAALSQWIADHINYPAVCKKNNIQGRVVVQFVVRKDGSIGEVVAVRLKDPNLGKEAVRVVKSLPAFTPGMQNGTPVNVWYTLPVTFKL